MSVSVPKDLHGAFGRLADAQASGEDAEPETRHLTRQSLAAHHFVTRVGETVRYDHARQRWLVWHGHGWRLDRDGEIRRLWLDTLAARYHEALLLGDGAERERALAIIKAAGALDSAIEAGLRIAASLKPVAMTGDEWDPDPWLLGCDNGVVDLRTGILRLGSPDDLVTRSTGLVYDPATTCPRWERFLTEVFDGDAELVTWFQRLIGATFVGASNEVLALHYGIGNNGKSVCFRTLGLVAGDYGVEIGIETLVRAQRQAGAPSSDLMRLRGARLAFTAEPERDARLRGGTLKRLSTIDKMTGRELQGRQQEWEPTHTIHLATNHLPEVDDPSEGFWRRIALVPWTVHFTKPGEPGDGPREDPRLAGRLAEEASGILGWVVRGAVAFGLAGLHPFPAAVARETAAYRAEEDPLAAFVERWLHPADDDRVTTVTALHIAYLGWADEVQLGKAERLNDRRFGRLFAERFQQLPWRVQRTTLSGRTAYRGLRIGLDADGPVAPGGRDEGFGGSPPDPRQTRHTTADSTGPVRSLLEATSPTREAPGPLVPPARHEAPAGKATDDDRRSQDALQ